MPGREFGAASGWGQVRGRLLGNDDDEPMIFCLSTCVDSIRTIPVLQHDPDRLEDLDTTQEDHAADDWRLASLDEADAEETGADHQTT
jgi:nitrate reductase beta subunit